jgi:mannose-6-phosphate isomerase-like protein (cupin superfamily)
VTPAAVNAAGLAGLFVTRRTFMRTHLLLAFLTVTALMGADHPEIKHWTAEDLGVYHERLARQLSEKQNETLKYPWQQGMAGTSIGLRRAADRHHYASMIHRSGHSYAEAHDERTDVYFVIRGGGTLILGGEMVDREEVPGQPGEWRAPRIRGGQRFRISEGDIINIPVGTPHQMDFEPGESVTYVMVKVIEAKAE